MHKSVRRLTDAVGNLTAQNSGNYEAYCVRAPDDRQQCQPVQGKYGGPDNSEYV